MYERALVGKEKTLGIDHPSTFGSLGIAYGQLGNLEKVESMLERALAGFASAVGVEHLHTKLVRFDPQRLELTKVLGCWRAT